MERDFIGILDYLKQYMKIEHSVKLKVKYQFVAGELKIKIATFAAHKSRNSIPYSSILDYCFKEDINPLNVFYDRKVKP